MRKNKRIRVLHLISGDLWAGAEVQAFVLVSSLFRLPELDLTAIVLNEGKLAKELRRTGLPVTVIDESAHGFFSVLRLIKENLKDKNIDILHSHRYKENVLGALLKKSGTVRYLVQTVHGLGEPFKGLKMLKARLYHFLDLHYTRKYFDKVQAVSFDIQEKLNRKIDPAKLVTIHNSVNTADTRVTRSASKIRSELGIGENQLIVGSVGRMVPVKGYDVFLRAARIILGKRPETRFILAGDGPSLQELMDTAREMGIQKHVMFLGFRDDPLDVINALDVFVVCSYHEGIPTVLLEAMALGKAVVATKVGGIPEIIRNHISGLLVEPGDVEGLASACMRILDKPAVRKKLEGESERRIKEEFTSEVQTKRILGMYHQLMSQA
jgi:glycosyltransferase involved in cell wall biosynthesis